MARGLDKDKSQAPPRRNPFSTPIVEISEEETEEQKKEIADRQEEAKPKDARMAEVEKRVRKAMKRRYTRGWSRAQIKDERERLREYFLEELEAEARDHLRDEIIAEKQKKAEPLIQTKLDHLASQGLEDLGEEWQHRVEGYLGLARDEYEISISPVTDDYLKEQGQGFAFTVTYSEEASLLRLYRSGGKWDDVLHWLNFETLDKGELEKKIGELIQNELAHTMRDEAVLVKDLASSEEEARAKAEAAIAEKMSSRLEDVKKYHEGILETQARERQRKEERERAERERKEAEKALQIKIQEVRAVFSGLEWNDPKFSSLRDIEKKIVHLTENGRDFKRERIGLCDLVTFYEDQPDLYGYYRTHSVGGAIFYQGKLKAFIEEDSHGQVKAVPYEINEKGFNNRVRGRTVTLFEPSRRQQRRRSKRTEDPEKNRAQVEKAAREYIDELIRQEVLKDIS